MQIRGNSAISYLQLVAQHVATLAQDGTFAKTIATFDKNFSETMVTLLTAISDHSADSKLLNILYRWGITPNSLRMELWQIGLLNAFGKAYIDFALGST